jgi:preprotein translocase subunit SecE
MPKKSKTWIFRALDFLKEAKVELKKVTWPTKKETFQYTVLVILVTVIIALFLWSCDLLFSFLIRKFFF